MQFTARVEIHNADLATYERLHTAMATECFSRILTGETTGKRYHMPIGHYWGEFSNGAFAVLEAAKRAALPIDSKAEIVVSGAGQIVFYGCPEVKENPLQGLYGAFLAQRDQQEDHLWASLLSTPASTTPKNDDLSWLLPAQNLLKR